MDIGVIGESEMVVGKTIKKYKNNILTIIFLTFQDLLFNNEVLDKVL